MESSVQPISKKDAEESRQTSLNNRADAVIKLLNSRLNIGSRTFNFTVFIDHDVYRIIKERYESVGWKVKLNADPRNGDYVSFE